MVMKLWFKGSLEAKLQVTDEVSRSLSHHLSPVSSQLFNIISTSTSSQHHTSQLNIMSTSTSSQLNIISTSHHLNSTPSQLHHNLNSIWSELNITSSSLSSSFLIISTSHHLCFTSCPHYFNSSMVFCKTVGLCGMKDHEGRIWEVDITQYIFSS